MNRWGCFGLLLGALTGLLVALLIFLLIRPVAPPPVVQPPAIAPDVTVFISEQSLSRIASQTLNRPTLIDFDVNGQMEVTTRTQLGRLEPVVRVGLQIELQGTEVVSQLRWAQFSFMTIPARWLPQAAAETAALAGQAIKNQTPPDFALVGLETTPEGVNFQLKWVGP
jgi:hypothetical protein